MTDNNAGNQYMDMYGGVDSTGGNQMQADSGALMQLAQKHDQYADEIQKIKDMLGEWLFKKKNYILNAQMTYREFGLFIL